MIETILAFLERETKNLPIWVVDPKLVSVAAGTLRLLIIVIWHQTSLSLFMIWRMLENIECYGKAVRRDFEARPFSQFSLRGALKKRLNLGKFSQMCEPTHPQSLIAFVIVFKNLASPSAPPLPVESYFDFQSPPSQCSPQFPALPANSQHCLSLFIVKTDFFSRCLKQ